MHTPPERYGVFVMTTSTNVVNGAAAAHHVTEGESAPTVLTTVQDLLAEVLGRLASGLGAGSTITVNVKIGKVQLGALPGAEPAAPPPDDSLSTDVLRLLAEAQGRLTLNELLDKLQEEGKEVSGRTVEHRLAKLTAAGLIDNRQDGGRKGYGLTARGKKVGPAVAAPVADGPRNMIQRHILETLREAGRRLTTEQLLREMDARGHEWTEDKARKALAEMVNVGLLTNTNGRVDGDGQKGYAPAE